MGRDEMRQGVASVLLSIQVSGKRENGETATSSITELPVPPPTERSAFKIDVKKPAEPQPAPPPS